MRFVHSNPAVLGLPMAFDRFGSPQTVDRYSIGGVSVPRPARLSYLGLGVHGENDEGGRGEGDWTLWCGTVRCGGRALTSRISNRKVPAVRAFPPQPVRQCCDSDVRTVELVPFNPNGRTKYSATVFSEGERLCEPPVTSSGLPPIPGRRIYDVIDVSFGRVFIQDRR